MSTAQRKQKPQERRQSNRMEVTQPPRGELRLCVDDQCLGITQVRDISPFGVCVLLNAGIADDAHVRLTYTHDGKRVEVQGTVVWRKAAGKHSRNRLAPCSYWVGIFLYPRYMDANVEFFQALSG